MTTAQNYPDTSSRFHQVVGTVKWQLPRDIYPKFEYRLERYDRTDFQIDRLNPYMVPLDPSTSTSIYLGADVPKYRAHIIAFGVEYRF